MDLQEGQNTGLEPGLEIVLASRFNNPENRRREAAKAAHKRDLPGLLELLAAYLNHKRSGFSTRTLEAYSLAVKRFLEFTEDPRVELTRVELTRATVNDLERFRDDLQRLHEPPKREVKRLKAKKLEPLEKPLAPSTRGQYLAGVSALYGALVWAKAASENPVREVVRRSSKTPSHE